jgi:hypothetical protein
MATTRTTITLSEEAFNLKTAVALPSDELPHP